jgi:hypothetical protein
MTAGTYRVSFDAAWTKGKKFTLLHDQRVSTAIKYAASKTMF